MACRAGLAGTVASIPWVATPQQADAIAEDAPLVLENGLLYLRRYREYERQLAAGLQRIGRHPLPPPDMAALAPLFAQLFPQALGGEDHQARAAGVTLRHPLALVTGGPGTGKTTTIARLLLLLAAQARHAGQPLPEVALAAPTGRAAERMAESLRLAVQRLQEHGVDPALCAALPSTGTTLHRLLGVIPDSPRFRHHADNPLPVDVVVVDEASMIDLPMMAKLVDAVASGTRLILLGDPDQLPSVEAGDVLSAILRASGDGIGTRADDAQALRGLLAPSTLQPRPNRAPSPAAACSCNVGTGRAMHWCWPRWQMPCARVTPAPPCSCCAAVNWPACSSTKVRPTAARPARAPAGPLACVGRRRRSGACPAAGRATARADRAARRPAGRAWPQQPYRAAAGGQHPGYFQGRLLLVTENSYRHRLFNGDIGICLRDSSGAMVAWFPGDTVEQPRAFHPAALPAHESAFAMTVHKAQGSEFDEVWLQLPRQDSRVLSRELVYTGLTRARQELHVAGSAEVLQAALKRHASRLGGLAWRLGAEAVAEQPARIEQPTVQGTLF